MLQVEVDKYSLAHVELLPGVPDEAFASYRRRKLLYFKSEGELIIDGESKLLA